MLRSIVHPARILFSIGLSCTLALTACGTSPQAETESTQAVVEEPAAAASEPPVAAPPAAVGLNLNDPAPAGSTVSTAGWEITVVEVLRGEAALAKLEEASAFNGAPEDPALEWAVLLIRARQVGDGPDAMRIAKAFFSSAGSDGTEYKRPKITDVSNPEPELDAVLASGQEAEGWITVFAPKDDAGLILVIQPYLYNGDTGISTGEADKRFLLIGQ